MKEKNNISQLNSQKSVVESVNDAIRTVKVIAEFAHTICTAFITLMDDFKEYE